MEIRVQIRGCSKIVGWNPPSPSIKMSQRVSCKWQILRGEREREKNKFSWENLVIYPELRHKIYIVGKNFGIKKRERKRERYIYTRAYIFLFGHIISIRFISFYYYSKVVDE